MVPDRSGGLTVASSLSGSSQYRSSGWMPYRLNKIKALRVNSESDRSWNGGAAMFYYLGIGLTIISNVFYHIFQKAIPNNVNPVISLIVTYLTAAAACLLILPFYHGQNGIIASLKQVTWASMALGIAIIGLEAGFLLAYRAGWEISLAAGVSNVMVAVLLVPIGLLFYREALTPQNIIGIVLCVGGLVLIQLK
jgi:uncharacterized membrane protein